jgi:hypothetical protein
MWLKAPFAPGGLALAALRHEKAFAFAEKAAHSGAEGL